MATERVTLACPSANGNVLSTEQALEALARHCPGLFTLAFEGLLVELADVRERLKALEVGRAR